jgi:hypothetical protein
MMWAGWSPDDGPEPEGRVEGMDHAEELFLDRIGYRDGSPWLFGVESADSRIG